jgi:hypothetical protein
VLVRDAESVRVYLNGQVDPDIVGTARVEPESQIGEWFFGGRNDRFSNLEGKLSDAAIYDRALDPDEVHRHFEASKAFGK